MNPEVQNENPPAWEESLPWVAQMSAREGEDSIDEVIRFTLDEIRIA